MRDGIRFIGAFGETYELVDMWRGDASPEGGVPVDAASARLVAMQSETLRDELARARPPKTAASTPTTSSRRSCASAATARSDASHCSASKCSAPAVTNVAPEAPLLSDLAQKPRPSPPAAPDVQFEVRVVDELGDPVAGV